MAHVDEIRFARRANCEDGAFKVCELRALDLEQVAQKLAVASQRPPGDFTAATLAPRLHILGPELSEGFFAEGVVLVEGPGDRSALVAAAHCLGVNFESAGIAILPVVGKNNIDRPLLIFRELDTSPISSPFSSRSFRTCRFRKLSLGFRLFGCRNPLRPVAGTSTTCARVETQRQKEPVLGAVVPWLSERRSRAGT